MRHITCATSHAQLSVRLPPHRRGEPEGGPGALRVQDGQYRFVRNRFWRDQMYCEAHLTDGTPCCCACERLEPRREAGGGLQRSSSGKSWVRLPDGRYSCLACLESMVVDTEEAQPLYSKVRVRYTCVSCLKSRVVDT